MSAPRARWRWQGPRLAASPLHRQQQIVSLLAMLLRRAGPDFRFESVLVGVELGDGRRRRLSCALAPTAVEEKLHRQLREWSDGREGSWVAGLHGLQTTGRARLLLPAGPEGRLQLGWTPEFPPDTVQPPDNAVTLRLADLEAHGHLDVELLLQGELLLAGRAAPHHRHVLAGLVERLGQGLILLQQEGGLPRAPTELPCPEPAPGVRLRLLRRREGERLTLELPPQLPPYQTEQIRQVCLVHGDGITAALARLLPGGPYSLPPECAGELIRELGAPAGLTLKP